MKSKTENDQGGPITALKEAVLAEIPEAEGVLILLLAEGGLLARGARGVDAAAVLTEGSVTMRTIDLAAAGYVRPVHRQGDLKPPSDTILSALAVPMLEGEKVGGVLYVENRSEEAPFPPAAEETLRRLGERFLVEVAPPPEPQEPTEPPRRRPRFGRFALVALLLALVFTRPSGEPETAAQSPSQVASGTSQVQTVADAFLTSLKSGEYDRVYAQLGRPLRRRRSLSQFVDSCQSWSQLEGTLTDLNTRASSALDESVVEIVGTDGQVWRWTFELEGGTLALERGQRAAAPRVLDLMPQAVGQVPVQSLLRTVVG